MVGPALWRGSLLMLLGSWPVRQRLQGATKWPGSVDLPNASKQSEKREFIYFAPSSSRLLLRLPDNSPPPPASSLPSPQNPSNGRAGITWGEGRSLRVRTPIPRHNLLPLPSPHPAPPRLAPAVPSPHLLTFTPSTSRICQGALWYPNRPVGDQRWLPQRTFPPLRYVAWPSGSRQGIGWSGGGVEWLRGFGGCTWVRRWSRQVPRVMAGVSGACRRR